MLLWKTLLCLLSANFVASQFASPELLVDDDPDTSLQPPGAHLLMARDPSPLEDHHLIRDLLRVREVSPEILVDYDPGTSLQPPESGSDAKEPSENRRFIRGLLFTRGVCPTGYDQCADDPSSCCPTGGVCCTGGCCKKGESCCSDGCCARGYYCTTVGGKTGCCPNGKTCSDTGGGGDPRCSTPGYLVCSGENFCCPSDYLCYRDSVGQPQCMAKDPQCTDPGYVVCIGENFCCPPDYTCYRDSSDNPKCRSLTTR